MAFIHLHVHSRMSLLDGMIRIEDMVEFAKDNGGAIAITDHGWVGGAAKFAIAAKGVVKPIIGSELYVVGDATVKTVENREWWHLILLAQTAEGYSNLCRLSSFGHAVGYYYKPRVDHARLKQYSKGIICLSGCIGSEVPQLFCSGDEKAAVKAMKWYQSVFGENYFIEIQDHGGIVEHIREPKSEEDERVVVSERALNEFLVLHANKLGIGIVATNDSHYLTRNHGEIHDTMLAMQTGTWKGGSGRLRFPGAEAGHFDFYLKSEKEMLALCKDKWWKIACANTKIVADKIEPNVITFGQQQMPQYVIPADPEFERWLKKRE